MWLLSFFLKVLTISFLIYLSFSFVQRRRRSFSSQGAGRKRERKKIDDLFHRKVALFWVVSNKLLEKGSPFFLALLVKNSFASCWGGRGENHYRFTYKDVETTTRGYDGDRIRAPPPDMVVFISVIIIIIVVVIGILYVVICKHAYIFFSSMWKNHIQINKCRMNTRK